MIWMENLCCILKGPGLNPEEFLKLGTGVVKDAGGHVCSVECGKQQLVRRIRDWDEASV